MKKISMLISILIIAPCLLCACTGGPTPAQENSYAYEPQTPIPPLNMSVEDSATGEMLEELNYAYGYTSLTGFSLYNENGSVMCDFYFSGEAEYWEIKSAMEFSCKKLHKADANQMFMRVFDGWIMQNEYYENGVDETLSRIYIDGTEVFSNLYNKGTLQSEYENIEAYLNARESPGHEETNEAIMNIAPGPQILWQKGFQDKTGIVHITTDKKLSENQYERVKTALSDDGAAWDKIFVVLFAGGEIYHGEVIQTRQ